MAKKVLVNCSQGHRFPVNLEKHANRLHVFCPRCRDKVTVRKKHIFNSNPDWEKEKEERRQIRLGLREMGRKPMKESLIPMFRGGISTPLLAIMVQFRKRSEEELKEQKKEA